MFIRDRIGTINTDLANKLGNLVSRTTGMAEQSFGGKLPVQREDAPEDCELCLLYTARCV